MKLSSSKLIFLWVLANSASIASASGPCTAKALTTKIREITASNLAHEWDANPRLQGNETQNHALYLGSVPTNSSAIKIPRIPAQLQANAEEAAIALRTLYGPLAEFEGWPTVWNSELKWVFSKVRINPSQSWEWINPKLFPEFGTNPALQNVLFPEEVDLDQPAGFDLAFQDLLQRPTLYDAPRFSNGVVVSALDESTIVEWPSPLLREHFQNFFFENTEAKNLFKLLILAQPADFNGSPWRAVLTLDGFDHPIDWLPASVFSTLGLLEGNNSPPLNFQSIEWDKTEIEKTFRDVTSVSSGQETLNGNRIRNRSAADSNGDLENVLSYLET